tara:strand:- start:340 stop:771 length:432 start_codon:yes stop_codon:yes gene_type:complete
MKYISMLLAAVVISGCSALENMMKEVTIESGQPMLSHTIDQNWILVLVMTNPTGHIVTIPVENYTSQDRCLEMLTEYSLQVPDQDKTQQLLCLLDNSPTTSNSENSEIPELLKPKEEISNPIVGPLEEGETTIIMKEVVDEII